MKHIAYFFSALFAFALHAQSSADTSPSASQSIVIHKIQTVIFQGQSVRITFSATGNWPEDNKFIAQLSDRSGDFSQPVQIGVYKGDATGSICVNGIIIATMPVDIPADTGYKVRIISSYNEQINDYYDSAISICRLYKWYVDDDDDGLGDPEKCFLSPYSKHPGCVLNASDPDDSAVNRQEISIEDTSETSVTLHWAGMENVKVYHITIKNVQDKTYQKVISDTNYLSLDKLMPGTDYKCRVRPVYKNDMKGSHTKWLYFKTGGFRSGKYDQGIIVYNNPSENGIFNMELLNYGKGEVCITITNSAGEMVYTKQMKVCSDVAFETISLKEYGPGIYKLELTCNNSSITRTLIVQKTNE